MVSRITNSKLPSPASGQLSWLIIISELMGSGGEKKKVADPEQLNGLGSRTNSLSEFKLALSTAHILTLYSSTS